jgi:hypothetical protein
MNYAVISELSVFEPVYPGVGWLQRGVIGFCLHGN